MQTTPKVTTAVASDQSAALPVPANIANHDFGQGRAALAPASYPQNYDFGQGLSGWTPSDGSVQVVDDADSTAGPYLRLSDYNRWALSAPLVVPDAAQSLRFSYATGTSRNAAEQARLFVEVFSGSDFATYTHLATPLGSFTQGWQAAVVDLQAFRGQTIKLRFRSDDDYNRHAVARVDNLGLHTEVPGWTLSNAGLSAVRVLTLPADPGVTAPINPAFSAGQTPLSTDTYPQNYDFGQGRAALAPASYPQNYDFGQGLSGWTPSDGSVQVVDDADSTAGPYLRLSDYNRWALSAPLVMPDAAQSLRFVYATGTSRNNDEQVRLFVEVFSGSDFATVTAIATPLGSVNQGWQPAVVDLQAFRGQTIKLRLRSDDDFGRHAVARIDNLTLHTEVPSWTPSDANTVQIVNDVDSTAGNYLRLSDYNRWALSAPFVVPDAAQSLRFNYATGTSRNNDEQVRLFVEVFSGSDFATYTHLATPLGSFTQGWQAAVVDLQAFRGQTIKLRLRSDDDYNRHAVARIDNLGLHTEVPGWTPSDANTVQVVDDTDSTAGNYLRLSDYNRWALSAPFVVPDTAQSLRFNYATGTSRNNDEQVRLFVEIFSGNDFATYTHLATPLGSFTQGWQAAVVDLQAFRGQTIKLRLRSDDDFGRHAVARIDNLELVTGTAGGHGNFANPGGQALTLQDADQWALSAPFMVPTTIKELEFDYFVWTNRNARESARLFVEVFSGTNYATYTYLDAAYGSAVDGWKRATIDLSAFRGRVIKLRLRTDDDWGRHTIAYIDNLTLTQGPARAPLGSDLNPSETYLQLNAANQSITSRAFQVAGGRTALPFDFVAWTDRNATVQRPLFVDILSGENFATTTRVTTIYGSALQGWREGTIDLAPFQNQTVKLRFSSDNDGGWNGKARVSVRYATVTDGDLAVSLTSPPEIIPGTELQYRITLHNQGSLPLEDVSVTHQLPQGMVMLRHTAPVEPTTTTSPLTWNLGGLAPDQQIAFLVIVAVPETAAIGATFTSTATASATAQPVARYTDTATISTTIVAPYSFTLAVSALRDTLGAGAPAEFAIQLTNTGWAADSYQVSVTGLDPAWVTLSQSSLWVAPGGTATTTLTVQATGCQTAGDRPFSVRVASSGGQHVETRSTKLTVVSQPEITIDTPLDQSTSGARTVLFSWRTAQATTGTLTFYAEGQPAQAQVRQTASGTQHVVEVANLSRNTAYIWQVKADSACGSSTTPLRKVTIGNGIVFEQRQQAHTIDRDYNQIVPIEVVNQDVVSHTLTVNLEHAYPDLIVNFIGSGSTDETITLIPGERRTVKLAVHTQDALRRDYDLVARLTADLNTDSPVRDSAVIHLTVLSAGDFQLETLAVDGQGVTTYRVTNQGRPITDLDIDALDTVGRPARVYLSPNVTHMRLGTDESLTFQAIPLFGPEDIAAGAGSRGAGLLSLANPAGTSYEVVASGGGKTQRKPANLSCPPGKRVFAVNRKNVSMRFPAKSWYCTNRPEINVPLTVPPFVNPGSVRGLRLGVSMKPGGSETVLPHDTQILFNGQSVGALLNQVPNGTYQFDVAPELLNSGQGGPVQQQIELKSQHMNPGHYVQTTDFELSAALDDVTVYVCAESQEEAERVADETYGFEPLPDEVQVTLLYPEANTARTPNARFQIPLTAKIEDDRETYQNDYALEARLTYRNRSDIPPQTIALFDDGDSSVNGDITRNDALFNALWTPPAGGWVDVTLTARSLNGLTATTTSSFFVSAKPDFVVRKVYQENIPSFGTAVRVHAEIANVGYPVDGPVVIEFRYYAVDLATGEPVGEPVHVSSFPVQEGRFDNGLVLDVGDSAFISFSSSLYYVDVIVDPDAAAATRAQE